MTEYWKSTPKHWCEVCRIWIADTPRIVKEHERTTLHQDKLSRKLSNLRREAEKDAHETAKVQRTLHDIESKAFAAYAADLKDQEKTATPEPVKEKLTSGTSQLKGKRKIASVDVPKHPLHNIGGDPMPKSGKIGGYQRKVTVESGKLHKKKKVRINEDEEEKARRLRDEARERVKQRNMRNFGLG